MSYNRPGGHSWEWLVKLQEEYGATQAEANDIIHGTPDNPKALYGKEEWLAELERLKAARPGTEGAAV